jgi:hypothetical protein
MIRTFVPILFAGLAAGCAEAPPPKADPAQVERLLAGLQAGDAALPPALEARAAKVDRVAGTIAKVEPQRVDPSLAAALITR